MTTPTNTCKKGDILSLSFLIADKAGKTNAYPVKVKFLGIARVFGTLEAYLFQNVKDADKVYELTATQVATMHGVEKPIDSFTY